MMLPLLDLFITLGDSMPWWLDLILGTISLILLTLWLTNPFHIEMEKWVIIVLFAVFFLTQAWQKYHKKEP